LDIKIDEQDWTARGLAFRRTGSVVQQYHFMIDGRSDVCTALVSGETISLFPERDVSHRALLSVLDREALETPAGFGRAGFGINIG
jgi:hypothetical protein